MKIRREQNPDDMTGLIFSQGMEKYRGDEKRKDQRPARKENENIAIDQIKQSLQDHA
jgi:hypothetical protein